MTNIYYNPEEFLLAEVGQIDFSDGCYRFDFTVVWKREDGKFVYADDAGCSCPAPFEATTPADLTVATPTEIQAHLEQRAKDAYGDHSEQGDRWAMQIANLMGRLVS